MLGIGDIIVHAENGQLTRIRLTRTDLSLGEDRAYLILEGMRFRKDGSARNRSETIYLDVKRTGA